MFQDELQRPRVRDQGEPPNWRISAVVRHGEGWAPPCVSRPSYTTGNEMKPNTQPIPDRSLPGLTRTALSAVYQGGSGKHTTGVINNKLRARDSIIIGTWNVRTLSATGKLEELTHEMNRYRWNILGLCEMRWKNFGETSTLDGHKLYFSGREDKHKQGVGFLVHNTTTNCIMGC